MSEEFLIKKIGKNPVLKKPILVEGFPGVGNVAKIVVNFLIDALKAKEFIRVYSYYFPNSVIMTKNHRIEMPHIKFYYYKNKKGGRDIVFVTGDFQPADEYESYAFSHNILDIAHSLKIKDIITLGGITSKHNSQNPAIYGAYTHESYIKPLKKAGVKFDREGSVIIIGAAGLLLGLSELKKMKGFALLAETINAQNNLGINAARGIINVLSKYLKLGLSNKKIDSELKEIKVFTSKISKRRLNKPLPKAQGPINYIG